MLIINENNLYSAAKASFLQLLEGPANSSDPTIWREDSAVISLPPGSAQPYFVRRGNTFHYQDRYLRYVPAVDPQLVATEEFDYGMLLLMNGKLDEVITYLRRHPASRRSVISTWERSHVNPENVGTCIVEFYMRMRDNELEFHSHARANDAYRLLLLDMQLALSIQHLVAETLGVSAGRYVHFVDSLHFYSEHELAIHHQIEYLKNSDVWNRHESIDLEINSDEARPAR